MFKMNNQMLTMHKVINTCDKSDILIELLIQVLKNTRLNLHIDFPK
jgi:hypothetical protein